VPILDCCVGIDSLLASEWQRLEEITALLASFTDQTNLLQSDAVSLSNILPALLDLKCHLQQYPGDNVLTTNMLGDFQRRFQLILQPDINFFNPLPAAASLLDPTVAAVLLVPEFTALLHAAKMYIVSLGASDTENLSETNVGNLERSSATDSTTDESRCPTQNIGLKRFKFLSARMSTTDIATTPRTSIKNRQDTHSCYS